MNTTTFVIAGASANRAARPKDGCSCFSVPIPLSIVPDLFHFSLFYSLSRTLSITDIFIFFSAGMNMALGLGWDDYSIFGPINHFRFSWFIGVIAGTLISLGLRYLISKKIVRLLTKLLILTEGIIFTAAPFDSRALLAGRYINGIAVGLAIVTFLIRSCEISANGKRGSCMAIEQYAMSVGMAIQMIYTTQWEYETFPANRLHGILDIIFAVLALLTAGRYHSIETPVDWLWKGQETAAWECLARLELPNLPDAETKSRLEELKEYVRYEANLSWMDDIKRGALPLLKMIFFRSMILAFSFSLPLSAMLQYSSAVNSLTWPPIVGACLRIFGGFIAQLQIDFLGRKSPSLFCGIVVGGLLTGIGGICCNFLNLQNKYSMSIADTLCLLIHFFAGCFAPFTSVYMGEAFPWRLKPYFMAIVIIVEQIIHIIVICTFLEFNSGVFLAPGIITILMSLLLFVTMPETRNTSLKESQGRFRQLIYLKFY
ncbi:galactose-proton symporter-like [Haematobia irritans]|uniref:galactose-proton symporter-like n=1 Tax=Haematobia irritans TaxID=7368 RepID=UPI003F4F4EF6